MDQPNRPSGPFGTGWIFATCYELAPHLEPSVPGPGPARSAPTAVLARVSEGWLHDRTTNSWSHFGSELGDRFGDGSPSFRGEMPADTPIGSCRAGFRVGPVSSQTGRERFIGMVARAKEYIRAGDVYQVNLAHPLRASFEGSPRALFSAMATAARPWHGAYMEWTSGEPAARHAIASVSPELFLDYDPATRVVRTRPMKGTLAASGAEGSGRSAADASALERSEKDRAELNMIIDLMRNDLGRSCVLGSVRVEQPRAIELHTDASGSGLLQATGCVSGVLREDIAPLDLLWNAFPPGSVTGAPKVRAMQIIRELEPEPRNFYCGAIGFIGDDGRLMLNVAIRTATITDTTIEYPVGAGIVADSDPESEWDETMAKAWPIIRVSQPSSIDCQPTLKKATP